MELNKLHILQRKSCAIRHRKAVTRNCFGVSGKAKDLTCAASGDDQRLAADQNITSVDHIDHGQSGEASVLDDDRSNKAFIVAVDLLGVLHQRVVQRLHFEEARFVRGENRTWIRVPSERSLCDVTIFRPRPGNAPVIEMQNFLRHLMHEEIHHILVSQKVRAFDRIPGVQFEAVAFILTHDSGRATLCRHGMSAHQLEFGNQSDIQFPFALLCGFKRGA